MRVKLTVLGCSGSVPGPESPASGYLLQADGASLVLDFGNGVCGALQRHLDPLAVDALLLTHLHPDHCADFGALTVIRRYRPRDSDAPLARLPVFAPEEAPSRLAALYAAGAAERAELDLGDCYDFQPQPATPARIGPFEVRAVPVNHVCEAWGYRISVGGRVLAYTGDTGPCPELAELAAGVDVLLSEASWVSFDGAPTNLHLSGQQAGEVAANGDVGRLLLTHLPPWNEAEPIVAEARAAFTGPVEFVRPGAVYSI